MIESKVDRNWLAEVSRGDVIVMWIADHCAASQLEVSCDEWDAVEFKMPGGETFAWNDDEYWIDGTDEPALYMIASIERERDAARAEVERLKQWISLHPFGACTCGGEDRCGWCARNRALEEVERLREVIAASMQVGCTPECRAIGERKEHTVKVSNEPDER